MDKLVNNIIEHIIRTILTHAGQYWKVYTGTVKALREHERLKKQLQEVMNNVDTMTPEERVEGIVYLEKHDRYADTLNKDLQVMEDGSTSRMPTIYKEGELISLEQGQNEVASIKERTISGLDQDKDLAPYVNQIIFEYILLQA